MMDYAAEEEFRITGRLTGANALEALEALEDAKEIRDERDQLLYDIDDARERQEEAEKDRDKNASLMIKYAKAYDLLCPMTEDEARAKLLAMGFTPGTMRRSEYAFEYENDKGVCFEVQWYYRTDWFDKERRQGFVADISVEVGNTTEVELKMRNYACLVAMVLFYLDHYADGEHDDEL